MSMHINVNGYLCTFNSKLAHTEPYLHKEHKNYWMIVCLPSKKIEPKVQLYVTVDIIKVLINPKDPVLR